MSGINCTVFLCHSRRSANKALSFHSFPKANERSVEVKSPSGEILIMDRLQAWIYLLKYEAKVTKNVRVCSLHFRDEDFIPSKNIV